MILIIGMGNMGSRYARILDRLHVPWHGIDITQQPWDYTQMTKCTKAIICAPTAHHFEWCMKIQIPFMCEKPISKYIENVEMIRDRCEKECLDGRMVNNWEHAMLIGLQDITGRGGNCVELGNINFEYSCSNTGQDGLAWDCIQLIHLCGNPRLSNRGRFRAVLKWPMGDMWIDVKITREMIERSYEQMIKRWLGIEPGLGDAGHGRGGWDMTEAVEAHKEVLEWIKNQK